MMEALGKVVTVRHWRVVNDTTGAIRFSMSEREGGEGLARVRASTWLGDGFHLELWEQTYTASPSVWTRQAMLVRDADGVEREIAFVHPPCPSCVEAVHTSRPNYHCDGETVGCVCRCSDG